MAPIPALPTLDHSAVRTQPHNFPTPTAVRTLKFKDSDEANNWLRSVTMRPSINPHIDPTIDIIASDRTTWVLHMIDAIYDLSTCFDNSKMLSHFQRTSPSFISELEVEAACHILFDVLVSYCRYGFQGLPKTNVHVTKSSSGRKNHEEDKSADCLTRMTNVIAALRSWKSVCKGVVEEDTKKWQLVNAPVGAVSKKQNEQKCNMTKKKATVEGKMAKDELVVMKQVEQVASVKHLGLGVGSQLSSLGEDGLQTSAVAGDGLLTPQRLGIVGDEVAGKWNTFYPEHADTTQFRPPTPQAYPPLSSPHSPLDSTKAQHEPEVHTQADVPLNYPQTSGRIDPAFPEPQPELYGLSPVNNPHDQPLATVGWPQLAPYDDFAQYSELAKIDEQEEHFWHQFGSWNHIPANVDHHHQHIGTVGQGNFEQPSSLDLLAEAALQDFASMPFNEEKFQTPPNRELSADDATEPWGIAGNEHKIAGELEASTATQDVEHDEAVYMPSVQRPLGALSSQQGLKRGRRSEDSGEDEPAARRQKTSDSS